jgi:hypothetical protein
MDCTPTPCHGLARPPTTWPSVSSQVVDGAPSRTMTQRRQCLAPIGSFIPARALSVRAVEANRRLYWRHWLVSNRVPVAFRATAASPDGCPAVPPHRRFHRGSEAVHACPAFAAHDTAARMCQLFGSLHSIIRSGSFCRHVKLLYQSMGLLATDVTHPPATVDPREWRRSRRRRPADPPHWHPAFFLHPSRRRRPSVPLPAESAGLLTLK